jgi:hypothetical protein
MRNENKKQKKQKPASRKTAAGVHPDEVIYGPKVDDTSMSAGNLVNNPRGRTRTRDLHTKISITGSDNDGQAD